MATFCPPAWISVAWNEAGDPTQFVSLRACTGAELDEALRHAARPDREALRNLRVLFRRAGGRDSDSVGVVLRLPKPADTLLRPSYFGNPSPQDVGTSDTAFRRKFMLPRERP